MAESQGNGGRRPLLPGSSERATWARQDYPTAPARADWPQDLCPRGLESTASNTEPHSDPSPLGLRLQLGQPGTAGCADQVRRCRCNCPLRASSTPPGAVPSSSQDLALGAPVDVCRGSSGLAVAGASLSSPAVREGQGLSGRPGHWELQMWPPLPGSCSLSGANRSPPVSAWGRKTRGPEETPVSPPALNSCSVLGTCWLLRGPPHRPSLGSPPGEAVPTGQRLCRIQGKREQGEEPVGRSSRPVPCRVLPSLGPVALGSPKQLWWGKAGKPGEVWPSLTHGAGPMTVACAPRHGRRGRPSLCRG